jgi:hypothetical protein
MAKSLIEKVGEVGYENLIADIVPPLKTGGATIAALEDGTKTYPRGTLLDQDLSSGLCALHGAAPLSATLVPYGVLTDHVTVGTDSDIDTTVYISGCFNPDALTVADGYELSVADKDAMRTHGILLATVQI